MKKTNETSDGIGRLLSEVEWPSEEIDLDEAWVSHLRRLASRRSSAGVTPADADLSDVAAAAATSEPPTTSAGIRIPRYRRAASPLRRGAVLAALTATVIAVIAVPLIVDGSGGRTTRPVTSTSLGHTSVAPFGIPKSSPFLYLGYGTRELRDAATGRVIRTLKSFGGGAVGNGLAMTPNGKDIFLVEQGSIQTKGFEIIEVSTVTGRQTVIGQGGAPSLSPDGRYLAYGTARDAMAIRDLATGRTRVVPLGSLVGPDFNIWEGPQQVFAFLGNDESITAWPGGNPVATSTNYPSAGGTGHSCSTEATGGTCLIYVNLQATHPGRTARLIEVPRYLQAPEQDDMMAVSASSLLVAAGDTIYTLEVGPSRAHITSRIKDAASLPMAIDPQANALLYLRGHGPVSLWVATFARGLITSAHELQRNALLEGIVW